MVQELGETAQEMMKADAKDVEDILNARPKGHFWVVIHHKPIKQRLDTGEHVLIRIVKAYDKKPKPLLGTIIHEVNNGEIIDTQVNVHDMPIDMERLYPYLGDRILPVVQGNRGDIAGAYVYNIL